MLAESPEVVCLSIHTKAVFNIMTLVYRFCARPDGIIMLSEVTYPLIISLQHEQVVFVFPRNLKSCGGGVVYKAKGVTFSVYFPYENTCILVLYLTSLAEVPHPLGLIYNPGGVIPLQKRIDVYGVMGKSLPLGLA
jgi:hypothetical protein